MQNSIDSDPNLLIAALAKIGAEILETMDDSGKGLNEERENE